MTHGQTKIKFTVTQLAVDVFQYISTDRSIKLAHEVARPSFRIVTWKVKIVWRTLLFGLLWLTTGGIKGSAKWYHIADFQLEIVPQPTAASDVTQRLVSGSVQSKGRQDPYRGLASMLSDTASYGKSVAVGEGSWRLSRVWLLKWYKYRMLISMQWRCWIILNYRIIIQTCG